MGARTRSTVIGTVALLAGCLVIPTLDGLPQQARPADAGDVTVIRHVPDRVTDPPSAPARSADVRGEGQASVGAVADGWRGLARASTDPSPERSRSTTTQDPLPSHVPERQTRRGFDAERGPGTFETVGGVGPTVGTGPVRTFTVEVESHLADHAERFAADVERVLSDGRGWTADGSVALRRVSDVPADVRVTLASPTTVDALCAPLETTGRFSCWNGERAVINAWRWEHGAATYGDDLEGYRVYLISHEVGHGLGHGHVGCPAPGAPAPVMMQQTVGVDGCVPNPWPYPDAVD